METKIKVFKISAVIDSTLEIKLNEIEEHGVIIAVIDNKGGDWKVIARCSENTPISETSE